MDCRTDRKMKIEKWAILDSTFGDGVLNYLYIIILYTIIHFLNVLSSI